jgi:muramoyltetrapeptide carboxypeptidase
LRLQATVAGSLALKAWSPTQEVSGILFGGCFTVLTNLIGTPYLPSSLAGHIVFFEDTDENPARLMRAFNQWLQSGLLNNAKALIIGSLRNLGEKIADCAPYVYEHFANRAGPSLPVFSTADFGHSSPNFPLMVGAHATIKGNQLKWTYTPNNAGGPIA